jgi:hypothetical protein
MHYVALPGPGVSDAVPKLLLPNASRPRNATARGLSHSFPSNVYAPGPGAESAAFVLGFRAEALNSTRGGDGRVAEKFGRYTGPGDFADSNGFRVAASDDATSVTVPSIEIHSGEGCGGCGMYSSALGKHRNVSRVTEFVRQQQIYLQHAKQMDIHLNLINNEQL